jgi:hypothetical protein
MAFGLFSVTLSPEDDFHRETCNVFVTWIVGMAS